jgi:hypothetical protein
MVIVFLLSVNAATIVTGLTVWATYGFWQAVVVAPIVGCVCGGLVLWLAGRRQFGVAFDAQQEDQLREQLSALTDMVESGKTAGQRRQTALTQGSHAA